MNINQRLFDHYGIDTNKDLKIQSKCLRPFDTVLIDKNGSCYACECQSWLPQSIGNLQIMTLEQILNSKTRVHLQNSVTDGTYRYCNQQRCSYLKSQLIDEGLVTGIKHLRLAIDDSCNLRCPSCRTALVFHKSGRSFKLGIKLANRINEWLETKKDPIRVHIGSDGDPFASHIYRHFMENTPRNDNLKYSILTNGLMFENSHAKMPAVMENLDELGVSIDGASKQTYESLRLGGDWEKIKRNLRCMSDVKTRYGFKLIIHFVVQKDNYQEMEKIIQLAEDYDTDGVRLNKIEDWGTIHSFKKKQDIFKSQDFMYHFQKVKDHISRRRDQFILCPTLMTKAERDHCMQL